jgi:hypothetical protein
MRAGLPRTVIEPDNHYDPSNPEPQRVLADKSEGEKQFLPFVASSSFLVARRSAALCSAVVLRL